EVKKQAEEMVQRDQLRFMPVRVEPVPIVKQVFDSRDAWSPLGTGWMVDRTIVFPYNDDYREVDTPRRASFSISNDRIAGWTTRAPHSSRLIGFARVDPRNDADGSSRATSELRRSVMLLGLRGLKLHPLSQLFVDEILEEYVLNIMKTAGELGIPVIIDARSSMTAKNIVEMCDIMIEERVDRVPAVIIAHAAMSPGSPILSDALVRPNIYTETSSLHGKDIPALFRNVRDRLEGGETIWSSRILFGTDYTFLSAQAVDMILYLLSREFRGTLTDIQRILGGNALTLVQRPVRLQSTMSRPPRSVLVRPVTERTRLVLTRFLTSLLSSEDRHLVSLDLMLPPEGTWPNLRPLRAGGYNGIHLSSYVLSINVPSSSESIYLWVDEMDGMHLSCTALGAAGEPTIHRMELSTQGLGIELMRAINTSLTECSEPSDFEDSLRNLIAQ
ncbi:MAG: amidohydrolase family protein, partial [Candidatus Thorarchaeota archaeon]